MLKVWVADELGQIKSCSIESRTEEGNPTVSETELVSSSEGHDRSDYVQIMALVKLWTAEKIVTGVAIARRGGSIEIVDPKTGDILWNGRDERVVGDDMFVALEEMNGYLFWCTNHGYFGFARLSCLHGSSIAGFEDHKLEGPISKARCHPRFPKVFAVGGKDVNLEIWRPTDNEEADQPFLPLWTAKNVKNDEYNLKQPVWISDLQFLDEDIRPMSRGIRIVVCTRFHQIRIYDTAVSRRPVVNVEYGSSPLVAMVLGTSDSEVIFSDSHANVTSFSLEKKKDNGKFAGPTGSVLALDVIKPAGKPGILACVGLDRYLRLYDISSRKSVGNIYCKSKMTSVLVLEGSLFPPDKGSSAKRKLGEEQEADDSDEDEDEDGEDSVWKKIPEVADVGALKRRRIQPQESVPTAAS